MLASHPTWFCREADTASASCLSIVLLLASLSSGMASVGFPEAVASFLAEEGTKYTFSTAVGSLDDVRVSVLPRNSLAWVMNVQDAVTSVVVWRMWIAS